MQASNQASKKRQASKEASKQASKLKQASRHARQQANKQVSTREAQDPKNCSHTSVSVRYPSIRHSSFCRGLSILGIEQKLNARAETGTSRGPETKGQQTPNRGSARGNLKRRNHCVTFGSSSTSKVIPQFEEFFASHNRAVFLKCFGGFAGISVRLQKALLHVRGTIQ